MTVRRVVGTETEYGIAVAGQPGANPMLSSAQIVNAYAQSVLATRRARWDFEEEAPLRDARGFDMSREVADPSQLTDTDSALANVILPNGARFYVDHAHPEYSAPETTNPRDALRWDLAGDVIVERAARLASAAGTGPAIRLYKNNTDGKGASYGSHENYLVQRSVPFADLVTTLTPFFVSRQVVAGAGRVGRGQDGSATGYQLSQRADFFEVEVGLETTLKRPIINTRDEPHADAEKYRRLHVIVGDANLAHVSGFLKVGTTSLVLAMAEAGFTTPQLAVERPVTALHRISHDPSLRTAVRLRDGRELTGVQLQLEYLDLATKFVDDRYGSDVDPDTREVLTRWESVLTRLERDPSECARELDWVAKLGLVESYRDRDHLAWDSPKLALVDLQWSDVRPGKGLYAQLLRLGRMERLVSEAEVAAAVDTPPEDTRAWFRGRCIARYGADVAAASWDSVIFDVPGRESLQRVPTLEPLRGTRAHVGALLEASPTAADLLRALGS